MKKSKLLSVITFLAICIGMLYAVPLAQAEDQTMKDSGINYEEITETINNPGAGYTSTLWYRCKPGNTPVYNPTGNLVLMFIDIGGFSSGINGTEDSDGNYTEGTDYELDDVFFTNVRATFENCRKNGCTIAVRFRYDANGKSNPEPQTFEKVLGHISQIKNSGLLEDYKDILMFVESGFVGAWGEQHSGKYTSLEYKAQLLEAMLDCVPDPIPVTVRTPNIFAKWIGIPLSEIGAYVSEEGSKASRVGLYNDGYMGSDSDLGTYSNREAETSWMEHQMLTTYFGGEFSGNLDWAKKYTTYLPENAIPEMYKTHLSYINCNIYSLYKDYTYSAEYDKSEADNSAYYGQTVFKFIRDHLGYRFVLRNSKLSQTVSKGGQLDIDFTVENTGFANPIRNQKAEVILERDGNYVKTQADIDTTRWYSGQKNCQQLSLKIPGELDTGKWNVYVRLSVGNNEIQSGYMRTVRFANSDTWNPALGANYLGSFDVAGTDDVDLLTDNTFRQINNINDVEFSDGEMLTVNNIVILDGQRSGSSEWTDSLMCIQSENNKLYVSADDRNLYIMAEIMQSAASPVYNLQIRHDGEFYWMYYTSGGFVYYNKGSYDGCVCKRTGNYVEFKIPFGDVMGIEPGTVFESIRVFIQDESNSWVSVGDLRANEYTVPKSFDVFSAERTLRLKENSDLELNAYASPENASYQWYFNGDEISGETASLLRFENVTSQNEGAYSVRITSENGIERTINICNIEKVYEVSLKGDVNNDGELSVQDVILLKKYLVKLLDVDDINFENAEMDSNGIVNVFDLILLKRAVLAV